LGNDNAKTESELGTELKVDTEKSLLENSYPLSLVAGRSKRAWELDFLRGLAIIMVVLDHIAFIFANVFGPVWASYSDSGFLHWLEEVGIYFRNAAWRESVWLSIIIIFTVVCGISCTFSKSNFKRGIQLFALSYAVFVVTDMIELFTGMPLRIVYGILFCLSVSILLFAVLDSGLNKLEKFILSKRGRTKNSSEAETIHNSEFIIQNLKNGIMAVVGLIIIIVGFYYYFNPLEPMHAFGMIVYADGGMASADYFPVLPWAGFVLLGAVLGRYIYKERKSLLLKLDSKSHAPIRFLGRNTIVVYILHQPIIIVLLTILGFFFGFNAISHFTS